MQKDLIDVAMMDEHEEKKELTKEEKEDLQDISRSEDEGFGIISEGYRCKEAKIDLPIAATISDTLKQFVLKLGNSIGIIKQ